MIANGIQEGNLSSNVALMQVYGEYLLNGGTYEGFMDLTADEVQLMLIVASAGRDRERARLLDGIAGMIGAKRR